ncbi:MAG: AMP-binding protein [Alphaproteobacteria bacterium]|nr:AMP-binding protein [Alphaproteobacteria bacterium]
MVNQLTPTGLLPDTFISVAEQIALNLGDRPDLPALVSVDYSDSISWAELAQWTARLAHYLHSKGVKANDRIAVLGENSHEHLILYYGIQAFGATYCTINTDINQNHLVEMLDRIEPKMVLWHADLDRDAIGHGTSSEWVSFQDQRAEAGLFMELSQLDSEQPPSAKNKQEDRCVICFTSGTSAQPKGVLHSFSNYQAIAQHQLERWSLNKDDRVLEFRSISWASAHMISLNATMMAGATLLFAKNFSRSRFVNWIETYQPTIIVAVPTVVNMLLEQPIENGNEVFASVRFISCSTAPLMPDAHQRFEDIYGVKLVQLYGMSEGGIVAANGPDTRVIGSVGTAGMYQQISIRDDAGKALPQGEIGDIETISAQHAQAYLHANGEIEPIRGKPLKTGDLGYLDDDGFLRITGRAKDVIIRGGVNISPLEIDALISKHPDVIEAVTFGIPDPVYGENIISWVTASPDSDLNLVDLTNHCAENLPGAKRPNSIEIVEAIPKNNRGKIDRNAAKELWQAAQ